MRYEDGDPVCADCWGDITHSLQVRGNEVYCDGCQQTVGEIEFVEDRTTRIGD